MVNKNVIDWDTVEGKNNSIITHISLNGRYKIQFERSATKGVDGFKVEACGDDLTVVEGEARLLLEYAKETTKPPEVTTCP